MTPRAFGAGVATFVLAAGVASSCASSSDPCSHTGDDGSGGTHARSSCAPSVDDCGSPKAFATTAVRSGTGRVLDLSGFARDPGAHLRIEADNGCGRGATLADGVKARETASVTGPDALYRWSARVTVDPTDWPAGGTVQIRALSKSDDTGGAGFVLGRAAPFEDLRCVEDNGHLGWAGVVGTCTRYTSLADQLADPVVTFVDTDPVPVSSDPSKPRFLQGDPTPTSAVEDYYAHIDAGSGANGTTPGARRSFSGWKCANGFADCAAAAGDKEEAHAVYFNHGDLGTGRDMHCREVKACDGTDGGDPPRCPTGSAACDVTVRIACYVTNYLNQDPNEPVTFPAPFPGAVDDAVDRKTPAATVAMESLVASVDCATGAKTIPPLDAPDRVRFYIYDTIDGHPDTVLDEVPLDSEGAKPAPGVCLSCHGGKFNPGSASVTGSSFLPFDTCGFEFSSRSGRRLADQQEDFRRLNAMVRDSLPAPAIRDLIDGWYGPKGVFDPTSRFDGAYVPPDWSEQKDLYLNVVKPHCRSCHAAEGATAPDLGRYSDFLQFAPYIQDGLCNGKPGFTMAERTYENFWSGPARAYLVDWLGSAVGPLQGLSARVLPQCQGQTLQCP